MALLTFGEGWHNNHHAFPTSARHGLAWYQLDPNWIGIRTLEALGLAWDVKVPRARTLGVAHGSRLTAQGVVGSSPEPTRPELCGLSLEFDSDTQAKGARRAALADVA